MLPRNHHWSSLHETQQPSILAGTAGTRYLLAHLALVEEDRRGTLEFSYLHPFVSDEPLGEVDPTDSVKCRPVSCNFYAEHHAEERLEFEDFGSGFTREFGDLDEIGYAYSFEQTALDDLSKEYRANFALDARAQTGLYFEETNPSLCVPFGNDPGCHFFPDFMVAIEFSFSMRLEVIAEPDESPDQPTRLFLDACTFDVAPNIDPTYDLMGRVGRGSLNGPIILDVHSNDGETIGGFSHSGNDTIGNNGCLEFPEQRRSRGLQPGRVVEAQVGDRILVQLDHSWNLNPRSTYSAADIAEWLDTWIRQKAGFEILVRIEEGTDLEATSLRYLGDEEQLSPGVSYDYDIPGTLPESVDLAFFWSSGTQWEQRLTETNFVRRKVIDGELSGSKVPLGWFGTPPPNASHLLFVVDPPEGPNEQGDFAEPDEKINNVFPLDLPDIQLSDLSFSNRPGELKTVELSYRIKDGAFPFQVGFQVSIDGKNLHLGGDTPLSWEFTVSPESIKALEPMIHLKGEPHTEALRPGEHVLVIEPSHFPLGAALENEEFFAIFAVADPNDLLLEEVSNLLISENNNKQGFSGVYQRRAGSRGVVRSGVGHAANVILRPEGGTVSVDISSPTTDGRDEQLQLPDDILVVTSELDDLVRVEDSSDNSSPDLLIRTGDGADRVESGFGDDQIKGEDGNDVLVGNSGSDTVYGGNGIDAVLGDGFTGPSVSTFRAFLDNLKEFRVKSPVTLQPSGVGDDTLFGGEGSDLLIGGHGDDRIFDSGGTFNIAFGDTFEIAPEIDLRFLDDKDLDIWESQLFPTEDDITIFKPKGEGEDQISVANSNFNVLMGGHGNDTLRGGTGEDFLAGGDGDDELKGFGGLGNVLVGGDGNDKLEAADDGDILIGDTYEFTSDIPTSLADGWRTFKEGIKQFKIVIPIGIGLVASGTGKDTLIGGAGNDWMIGGDDRDDIKGNDGWDIIFGDSFDINRNRSSLALNIETLVVFAAASTVTVNPLIGAAVAFLKEFNDVADVLSFTGTGNDTIDAGGGSDLVFGGNEVAIDNLTNDVIDAGDGFVDIVLGNNGNDKIDGGEGVFNFIFGNEGHDKIESEAVASFLMGDGIDLTLFDLEFTGEDNGTFDLLKSFSIKTGATERGKGDDEITSRDLVGRVIIGGHGKDRIDVEDGDVGIVFGDALNASAKLNISSPELTMDFTQFSDEAHEHRISVEKVPGTVSCLRGEVPTQTECEDNISSSAKVNLIVGGDDRDVISASSGRINALFGNKGSDFITGGTGVNLLVGGDGGPDHRTCNRNVDCEVISGELGAVNLIFGDEVKVFEQNLRSFLLAESDTLFLKYGLRADSGTGSDIIRGGNGADFIVGGDGDDLVDAAGGFNLVFGDGLLLGSELSVDASEITDEETFFDAARRWLDVDFNFSMPGRGNDVLTGGGGLDIMFGAAGNDTITGGDWFDLLVGGDGRDVVDGEADSDHVEGGPGNDVLFGREGNDHLESAGGDDVFYGGLGNDTIFGGAGGDFLYGAEGDDHLVGGGGNDWIFGQQGNDSVLGEGGNDQIFGGPGEDSIDGGAGENEVVPDANPFPGDYNADGVADEADFAVWRETLGSTEDLRADGDGDGTVTGSDYLVWRNTLGRDLARETIRLAGDADGNGVVDLADYIIVRQNFGRSGDVSFADGDFDGDGQVQLVDLMILLVQFGRQQMTPTVQREELPLEELDRLVEEALSDSLLKDALDELLGV